MQPWFLLANQIPKCYSNPSLQIAHWTTENMQSLDSLRVLHQKEECFGELKGRGTHSKVTVPQEALSTKPVCRRKGWCCAEVGEEEALRNILDFAWPTDQRCSQNETNKFLLYNVYKDDKWYAAQSSFCSKLENEARRCSYHLGEYNSEPSFPMCVHDLVKLLEYRRGSKEARWNEVLRVKHKKGAITFENQMKSTMTSKLYQ